MILSLYKKNYLLKNMSEIIENPTLEEFAKNKTYIGVIEKTVFGGKGLISIEGFKILIKNGIEGQKVEYLVTKKKKSYAEGRIEKVLEHSELEIPEEERRNALPGCPYQNISYENQLKMKYRQLSEIFRNYEDVEIPEFKGSPEVFGYRNKMEFSIGYEKMTREIVDGKKIWKDEGVAVGFHPAGSWSDVVSIDDVFLASEAVNIIRREVEAILKRSKCLKKAPWNPLISKGFWRGLIFRESKATGDIAINFVVHSHQDDKFWERLVASILDVELPEGSQVVGILETVNAGRSDAVNNPEITTLYGDARILETLGKTDFEISPFSFFQTNSKGAEVLYDTVKSKIGDTEGKNVLDLFCGAGTIGIYCASDANKIVGIEMVREAVKQAKHNAKINDIDNAEFIAGKVEMVLPEVLEQDDFDTVIIDPPRVGMHPKALQYVAKLPIKKLVYISCNPSTLERDVDALKLSGWRLKEVQGVDMFPHTPHMEVIAVIEKD